MKKSSIIRTIYLYLFALLGLVLLTIGCVRFLDMGLKAFVFTKAEEEQRIYHKQPPVSVNMERLEKVVAVEEEAEEGFSKEEKIQIQNMIKDYKEWKELSDKVDPITSRRHRDASINLSLILVGLPLYLYHWFVIKRETKRV